MITEKRLSEADESKTEDSHAAASARIKLGLEDTNRESLPCVQKRALELFNESTREMKEKYGEKKAASND